MVQLNSVKKIKGKYLKIEEIIKYTNIQAQTI